MNQKLVTLKEALLKNRYEVSCFDTKERATEYLKGLTYDGIIGFGDSASMESMMLNEALSEKNTVIDPKKTKDDAEFMVVAKECLTTDYFFTSVNAITEDGVIVNLDGSGNRVAGSLFGHKKMFYIIGKNKIAKDLEAAIWRTRNIAAPMNAHRLKLNTPCAVKGDKCYDCSSPERICNGLLIQYKKMNDMEEEVILINEDLGF